MARKKEIKKLMVRPGEKVDLSDYETDWTASKDLKGESEEAIRERADKALEENRKELSAAQELLWASNTYSILIVLQGLDTAGKDGTIKHVMSGVNPQGCKVASFKVPTPEELDHDFLWRYSKALPGRGEIGIFNRSYYEEVLVLRVHPDVLASQPLPPGNRGDKFWNGRYEDINAFEKHLYRSGTRVLKFFLHISKEEQRQRLLKRLENEDKNWKFSLADLHEREFWDDYVRAYEAMLGETSTKNAPWYIIPADQKWATWSLVSDIVAREIRSLDLEFPKPSKEEASQLEEAKKKLEGEG
ncbi:MAG TPA: polyphosphate kinase 2 family protein [Methanomassiliicoccales archaeon]|nr:polyphosphate kinase 2 family protein [Methanomassiliicoccales archaeon]